MSEGAVVKLHEMLDNWLRFDQKHNLYQDACDWIYRRLKERAYPFSLKPGLVQLMTMIVRSMNPSFIDYF